MSGWNWPFDVGTIEPTPGPKLSQELPKRSRVFLLVGKNAPTSTPSGGSLRRPPVLPLLPSGDAGAGGGSCGGWEPSVTLRVVVSAGGSPPAATAGFDEQSIKRGVSRKTESLRWRIV
jgi:hypothetical protein